MEIKRQHIFDDIIGEGSRVYHSAILTCYSFDPVFFSNFYKPELNIRGIRNQIVLVDDDRLDEAIENERLSCIPGVTSFGGYTALRISTPTGGVFHPKIGLFIGEKRVTAIVGSGNLTYSGMSFNNEAWCAFSASSVDSQEAPLIASAWAYLKSVIGRCPMESAEMQLAWMTDNSALLQAIASRAYSTPDSYDENGEILEFVANSSNCSILQSIVQVVGGEKVRKITICTPFFDHDGTALLDMIEELSPEIVECLVKKNAGALPFGFPLTDHPSVRFFQLSGAGFGQMVHAKLIQIETTSGTILAAGSANASTQALGHYGKYANDEADILIRCNHEKDYLKELGIEKGCIVTDLAAMGTPSEKDSVRRIKREAIILGCELLEDGYHLSLDKGVDDVDCVLESVFGEKEAIHLDNLENETVVSCVKSNHPLRFVSLERNGERISNLCCIIIKSEVEKTNPDSNYSPIAPLLDGAKSFKDFEQLLTFVHIEEEAGIKSSGHSKSHRDADKKELYSGPITDEDLEERVCRQRISAHQQFNDRILDRILRVLTDPPEETPDYSEHPEDEEQNPDTIDSGLIDDDTPPKKEFSPPEKAYSAMDEARNYLRRLLEHYDSLAWKSDSFDRIGLLVKRPFYIQERADLALSAICIAVYEMCKVAKLGTRKEWNEMMGYFPRLVGSFLLIYRDPPADLKPGSPVAIKLSRKHRNLLAYSLLLIASGQFFGENGAILRLLALNLFDSYKEDLTTLDEVMEDFENLLSRKLIPTNKRSENMIKESYAAYLIFNQNKESKKKDLRSSVGPEIIYRPSFGFASLKDIVKKKGSSDPFPVTCTVVAPGFPQNHIKRTTLRESVICFET